MQRYNNNNSNNNVTNMTFDDSPSYFGGHESFGMDTTAEQADPSAGFAGLGELPSVGMESGVDQHGSFTGDLNASAYDVGEDHSQLLHDMLQQQQQSQTNQSGHSPQASQGGASASAWEDSLHVLQEMLLLQQQQQAQQIYQSQAEQVFSHAFSSSSAPHDRGTSINHHHHHQHATTAGYNNNKSSTLYPGESELLSLLQLPRTLSLPSSTGYSPLSSNRGKGPLYSTSTIAGPVNTGEFFESRLGLSHGSLHHGTSHTAASFFHSLPRGDLQSSNHSSSLASSLLTRPAPILLDLEQHERGDADDGKAATTATSPFGLKRDQLGIGKTGGEARGVNHFATERQRREFLNEKYQTLRALVPNPTKADRASIVADAIDYVKELKRTVQELQHLVQDKRRAAGQLGSRKRSHRCMAQNADGQDGQDGTEMHKGSEELLAMGGVEGSSSLGQGQQGQLRSSWVQRTSQGGTQVDVRIVHDEVTVKLSQRRLQSRSSKCLLLQVFSALQELRLDLLQATGASIGEHDVFLFNSKILEGSSTFAGYIAAKMLDAVDPRPLM